MPSAESGHGAEGHPQRRRAPWGVLALVLLTGLALMRNGTGEFEGPPQPASAAAANGVAQSLPALPPGPVSTQEPLFFSPAMRVRIPVIQVDAPVQAVGLDAEGWVDAPPAENSNLAGWFTGAVSPGERGTSVLVGHVDNNAGPAVFFGLGALKQGNQVEVLRADGRTAIFEIYGVEVFAKDAFPSTRVYGSTGTAELRVITCGGAFSRGSGYNGNVVVFARLVEVV
jgi:hypothetical protein